MSYTVIKRHTSDYIIKIESYLSEMNKSKYILYIRFSEISSVEDFEFSESATIQSYVTIQIGSNSIELKGKSRTDFLQTYNQIINGAKI
jgi:hypothetical protein